jgi:uncharacterized membrane protein YqjE
MREIISTGIGWIILGCIYYFVYKKKNDYTYKITCNAFIIIGISAIIFGIIDSFYKLQVLEDYPIILLVIAIIYIPIKMKQYYTSLKVADKLTENIRRE